tara:strand:- start:651 stop:968 length:318 start_codon:yes stop_codon:yes gene_type:complete
MSIIRTNITSSPTETPLIALGDEFTGNGGRIKKISIANFSDHADGATVNLFLEDASDVDFYIIKNVNIPKGTTLVLTDNIAFDSTLYGLKLYNTGTSPALTVTIS